MLEWYSVNEGATKVLHVCQINVTGVFERYSVKEGVTKVLRIRQIHVTGVLELGPC